ncbi:hypothetical protein CPter291_0964 [Collimonas pratensis]|uniref:Uncharacterized protein n=1 Tax=Collimonas pratensis TaxID=279113 RepID=A0A127Q074_9BURK|nr:hypothetical protein CPter91_1048 [Collimonas pratensis]AMP13242.1 hypothetical protein CPter291_0964 [Collimonas pratensis]
MWSLSAVLQASQQAAKNAKAKPQKKKRLHGYATASESSPACAALSAS